METSNHYPLASITNQDAYLQAQAEAEKRHAKRNAKELALKMASQLSPSLTGEFKTADELIAEARKIEAYLLEGTY